MVVLGLYRQVALPLETKRKVSLLLRLDKEKRLSRAIDDVVVHPLGFSRIYLSKKYFGYGCVINMWPIYNGEFYDVHDHCYDFESVILNGSLKHKFFKEVMSSNVSKGHNVHQVVELEYVGGSNVQVGLAESCSKKKYIVKFDESVLRKGDSYELQSEVMHHAYALSPGTITMQIKKKVFEKKATVWKKKNALDSSVPRVSTCDVLRKFSDTISLL